MNAADHIRANAEVIDGGCWRWTRYLDSEGYGKTSITGRQMGAHRASYTVFVGPIPDGATVDHLCFKPWCVNPEHLRLLSSQENARNKDPRKPGPWTFTRTPKRPKPERQPLPADAPVIDFEEAS